MRVERGPSSTRARRTERSVRRRVWEPDPLFTVICSGNLIFLFGDHCRWRRRGKSANTRPGAGRDVEKEMRRYKKGTARSGPRRQRRQGEKPQTGYRDWPFQGAQGGQARAEEEEMTRAAAMSRATSSASLGGRVSKKIINRSAALRSAPQAARRLLDWPLRQIAGPRPYHGSSGRRSFRHRDVFDCRRAARHGVCSGWRGRLGR